LIFEGFKIKQHNLENKQSICQVKYTKDFFSNYSKHFHDKLNINLIEEGEILIEFKNNRKEIMKPKQFSIFRPDEIHQTKPIKKTTGYYSLYFDNQLIENYLPIVLNTNVIDDEVLYSKLLNISNSLLYKKENIDKKILDFLEQLSLKYFKNVKEDVKELILINDIKEYIVTNIDFPPTLDEISKKYNLSKEHIIRVFKKELGLTPHAFITNYKINQAKNLLLTNSLKSLSEVAIETGFYDQSHFSKAFKRVFAITPSKITK